VTPSLLGLLRQACIECRACPLRDGAVSEVTPVFGRRGDTSEVQIADPDPAAIRLVIVGEAPGPQENTVGRPFIGPAGDILASLLLQAGIDTGKVWITNAVACWPHEAGKSGRASTVSPSPHALSVCPDRHLGPQLDVFSEAPVVLALAPFNTRGDESGTPLRDLARWLLRETRGILRRAMPAGLRRCERRPPRRPLATIAASRHAPRSAMAHDRLRLWGQGWPCPRARRNVRPAPRRPAASELSASAPVVTMPRPRGCGGCRSRSRVDDRR
jgi:uracil-DNA glycosylase